MFGTANGSAQRSDVAKVRPAVRDVEGLVGLRKNQRAVFGPRSGCERAQRAKTWDFISGDRVETQGGASEPLSRAGNFWMFIICSEVSAIVFSLTTFIRHCIAFHRSPSAL